MTISEMIRLLMIRRKKTLTSLAADLGMTRQNLYIKLQKENFTLKELEAIAAALGCEFKSSFVSLDIKIDNDEDEKAEIK